MTNTCTDLAFLGTLPNQRAQSGVACGGLPLGFRSSAAFIDSAARWSIATKVHPFDACEPCYTALAEPMNSAGLKCLPAVWADPRFMDG
jgi:hypothetical protein